MAKTVRIFTKTALLGSGKDQSGVAVNRKAMVTGRIVLTSYTASGEPLTANDLGLDTIDVFVGNVESLNDAATVPASATIGLTGYDRTSQLLIINTTGTTANTTSQAAVVRFAAWGDSASDAILT